MGLVYPRVCVQPGIDHDPVDKVINHGGARRHHHFAKFARA
jgi:hypothetical protein